MFNVLNKDWKKIKVAKIDIKIHKHLLGREFTKEDGFNTIITMKKPLASKKR